MKFLIILNLIFLGISCKYERPDNEKIYLEFENFEPAKKLNDKVKLDSIIFNKNYIAFFEYSNKGKLRKIRSTLDSRPYGHFFRFDDFGNLNSYYYSSGDGRHNSSEVKKYVIAEKYKVIGSPFVDYMENISDSSLKKYSLLFSEFPRKIFKASISINGDKYVYATLHKSKMMPLLQEADIYINKADSIIFVKTESNELYLKLPGIETGPRIFYDTVRLK